MTESLDYILFIMGEGIEIKMTGLLPRLNDIVYLDTTNLPRATDVDRKKEKFS